MNIKERINNLLKRYEQPNYCCSKRNQLVQWKQTFIDDYYQIA